MEGLAAAAAVLNMQVDADAAVEVRQRGATDAAGGLGAHSSSVDDSDPDKKNNVVGAAPHGDEDSSRKVVNTPRASHHAPCG